MPIASHSARPAGAAARALLAAAVLVSTLLLATSAQAYSPQIDFRDATPWSASDQQASFTGTAAGITLTLQAKPEPAKLWWDGTDGSGVRLSYENDEIESQERLKITFAHEVDLSAIYISDLFYEDGYSEMGSYRINDEAWQPFDAVNLPGNGNGNGEHVIDLGGPISGVSMLRFRAPGEIGDQDHEFALMGLDARPAAAHPMPEPSAALLFATGFLVTARRRRR